jgi:hypothetical protein
MRIAMNDLKLDRLWVVCPGERRYALAEAVEVVPLREMALDQDGPASYFKKRRRSGSN